MLCEHFSLHEGKLKSPVETFVLKLYLNGWMRLMVLQQGEWSELKGEKQEKPNLQKITRGLAISKFFFLIDL